MGRCAFQRFDRPSLQPFLTLTDLADLRARGIVTKVRSLKTGQTAGGIPFTRGPLAYLLRNCTPQIGEASLPTKVLKGIGAIEAGSGALDIKIVCARVDVTDHDERQIG
jgi:hypothetical protein